ncbi:response regulator [Aquibaculum arenosum]|uniref:Response regulator n=1 Tax=Aquibaculum arenosum TaxID=3032591 RepID=A0ABT5YJF5_9PROT|nr:response regulator [Fodinicurvata sp. CAU 1616]MDF2095070.1 response regulator [Fodinicurvata sp. CAU 1616]
MPIVLPDHWTLYVLENDEAVRESICALAASNGWHYRAFDTAEAFSEIKPPCAAACLLVDWDLPDAQPSAFLRILREREPKLPVVVMTARDDEPTLARIHRAGSDAVLPRPFSFSELSSAVAKAFATDKAPLR